MWKNYLKIAIRNLLRNKGFSITNILGLTIGCASTLFILLWVHDELTFNKFHQNYEKIYQVMANRNYNEEIFTDLNMVFPLGVAIEEELPEVQEAVMATYSESHILGNGDTKARKIGITASDNFFKVFSWEFLYGNAATSLSDPNQIILTESTANSLFGTSNPINQTVKLDNSRELTVVGILKDIPSNSTFQFDYVHAFNYSDEGLQKSMTNWTNSSWNVFLDVLPGTDPKVLSEKITALKIRNSPSDKGISEYFAFPMSKWRLYGEFKEGVNTGGMIQYVKMFSIIAVIMLLVACVNFMNLSTARSERRAKEVGIRKTLGSDKKQLMLQFFFESILLTVTAFILSLLVVYLLMPFFNEMVGKKLTLDFDSPVFWIISAGIVVFTGLVAGSYPALYLSSFSPIKVLKGTFLAGEKAVLPRNILVVGQFVASILLISGTLIVYQQIQYIKNRDLGYNPNNLVMISTTEDTQKNFFAIKDELLKSGMVQGVTRTFSPVTSVWWRSPAPNWEGKPSDLNLLMAGLYTDVGFSETMGVKMVQGNDFTGMPSDSTSLILNQATVEAMGLKEAVGTQMRYNGTTYNVIGVTENVVMDSPFKPVEPMMMFFAPEITYSISVRFKDGIPVQDGLLALENVFKTYNPSVPFEYQFVDQEFGKKFVSEELVSKLTNVFAALTIFVCCIGLAGLASHTIEKRFREIGIRKVLGASISQVLLLISTDFLKLVLIAFFIAAPLAYWKMGEWLETYTYHVNINLWLFVGVGVLVLFLALVVVTANTMKAALANPVKSLKSE